MMILTLGGTSGSSATAYRSSTPSHLQQQRGGIINLTSLSVQKVQPFCLKKMLLIKWSNFWSSCYKIWLILGGGGYYYNNSYYRTGRSKSAHGGTRTKQVRKKTDHRGQFYQHFTCTIKQLLHAQILKAQKDTDDFMSFCTFGIFMYKSFLKIVGEVDPCGQAYKKFLAHKERFRFFCQAMAFY